MAQPETVRIVDRPSAEAFLADLAGRMRALAEALARESEGVRAGRLREALSEPARKAALAAAYMTGLETAKANAVALARHAPAAVAALREAHRHFAAAVETNQAVLATARTVSEGLVKTLAAELDKARTPSVYGQPSHPPSPYGRGGPRGGSLVLSRSL